MSRRPVVLVTNDDGYAAQGIVAVADALREFAGVCVCVCVWCTVPVVEVLPYRTRVLLEDTTPLAHSLDSHFVHASTGLNHRRGHRCCTSAVCEVVRTQP